MLDWDVGGQLVGGGGGGGLHLVRLRQGRDSGWPPNSAPWEGGRTLPVPAIFIS